MKGAQLVASALAFVAGISAEQHNLVFPMLAIATALAVTSYRVAGSVAASVLIAFAVGLIDSSIFGHSAPGLARVRTERSSATVVDARRLSGSDATELTLRLGADGSGALADVPGTPPAIGTRLVLRGKREPFDEPRNPGEPSERELEAERGITWRIARARVVASMPVDPLDATLWIPRARAAASERIHALLPEPEATILAGAMWGERGSLPPDLHAEFQDTGTVHVLVTAGLHLGVVAALAVALLQALRSGRIGASLGAIPVVWFYAAFSGGHLPSLRAATMLSFALLARAAGREAYSWNALAVAAIVVAALRPASVSSVSFALSFSCVTAIFAFAPPIGEWLERLGVPHAARDVIGVTVAAQLGTWPLTAAAFLVIAPYAPLANAVVVPVVGVAMLVGFALLALSPVPLLATLVANVETSLVDWMIAAVRFVAALPGAHLVATPPPGWALASYDVALGFAALSAAKRRFRTAVALAVAGTTLCLWPPRAARPALEITAIDVGQADALLVRTPSGHAYLVDAGGRLERGGETGGVSSAEAIGERIVVPFLIRQGVHHLDGILLSHPHGDHAGGIAPVLRTLGANGFADSGQSYPGHAYHDALDVAQTEGVPMLEPRGGDILRTDDGITFRFYGPTSPYITGSRNDINNNSLIFRLEYAHFTMLFMGDAGAEAEARLLAHGDDLHADVLKVGHHGSAYGTTPAFIRAVAPRYAIISVGRHNLFGHPAQQTLQTLRDARAGIYRTDEDAAVTVTTNGTTVAAQTTQSRTQ